MKKIFHKITVYAFLTALMVQPADAMMSQVGSKWPKEFKISLIAVGVIGTSIIGSSLMKLMFMSQDDTIKVEKKAEQKNEIEEKSHSEDFKECIDDMKIVNCETLEYNDSEGTYLLSDLGKELCNLWSRVYTEKKPQKLNEDLRWCDKKKSRYGIVNKKIVAFAIVDNSLSSMIIHNDVINEFSLNVISNSHDYAKNLAYSLVKPGIFGKGSVARITEDTSNSEITKNKKTEAYVIFNFSVQLSKE